MSKRIYFLGNISNLFDSSLRFKPTYKCINFLISALVKVFEINKEQASHNSSNLRV